MIDEDYAKIFRKVCLKLGTKALSNYDIEDYMIPKIKKRFRGVFACDEVPDLNIHDSAILNLDDSNGSGTHWIAIYKPTETQVIVYDSFGRAIQSLSPEITSQLKTGGEILKNTRPDAEQQETGPDSETCGQRSISWLLYVYQYGPRRAIGI